MAYDSRGLWYTVEYSTVGNCIYCKRRIPKWEKHNKASNGVYCVSSWCEKDHHKVLVKRNKDRIAREEQERRDNERAQLRQEVDDLKRELAELKANKNRGR